MPSVIPYREFELAKEKRPWYSPVKGVASYKDLGLPDFITKILETGAAGVQVGDLLPIIGQMKEGQSIPETLLRDRSSFADYASLPAEILGTLGIGPTSFSKSKIPTSKIFQGEDLRKLSETQLRNLEIAHKSLGIKDPSANPITNLQAREYIRRMTGWEWDDTTGHFITETPSPKNLFTPEFEKKFDASIPGDAFEYKNVFDLPKVSEAINHHAFKDARDKQPAGAERFTGAKRDWQNPDIELLPDEPSKLDYPNIFNAHKLSEHSSPEGHFDIESIFGKASDLDELNKVVEHELNHSALYQTAGPDGDSPTRINDSLSNVDHQRISKIQDQALDRYSDLVDMGLKAKDKKDKLFYSDKAAVFRRIATNREDAANVAYLYARGESLSRAAERRAGLTAEELRARPPARDMTFEFGTDKTDLGLDVFDQYNRNPLYEGDTLTQGGMDSVPAKFRDKIARIRSQTDSDLPADYIPPEAINELFNTLREMGLDKPMYSHM